MTRHTYKQSYFQYEEVTITNASQQVSRMGSGEKKKKKKEKIKEKKGSTCAWTGSVNRASSLLILSWRCGGRGQTPHTHKMNVHWD